MIELKNSPAPWKGGCDAHGKPLLFQSEKVPFAERNDEYIANRRLLDAAPEMFDVLDAWSNAHWLAGIDAVENSNDPIEALLFKTRKIMAKAAGIIALHEANGGAA